MGWDQLVLVGLHAGVLAAERVEVVQDLPCFVSMSPGGRSMGRLAFL